MNFKHGRFKNIFKENEGQFSTTMQNANKTHRT